MVRDIDIRHVTLGSLGGHNLDLVGLTQEEALESLKTRLKRRIATRSGKGNQPLIIKQL